MPANRLYPALAADPFVCRPDARPDAELLTRFLAERDETAFAALVVRHTPAVRAACRGWLRSPADIDDAAQATFLVLVRRADSVRNRAALGAWLYRVAENVARRLRHQSARAGPLPEDVPAADGPADDGLAGVIAEEVARLPEKYRRPVQLCYAAGLTTAEAAERLGWPKGTVLTRLAWARKRLQKRLADRGAVPAVLATAGATRAVSPAWVWVTTRAAKGLLDGQSPASAGVAQRTVTLSEGVAQAMAWNKLKYVAVALLATTLIGFGVGKWAASAADPAKPGAGEPANLAAALKQLAAKEKQPAVAAPEPARADEGRPVPGRRREAVIKLPVGTWVKEFEVGQYGAGRLTWNYEEDRVSGLIEGSAMGGEIELTTDAEYSLSSNGTIYGVLTNFKVTHFRLPEIEDFGEYKQFLGMYPLVEPLINDVMTDLPFSYQFRVIGDRLVISNFRMLLCGPNPLGKLGVATMGNGDLAPLAAFQALAIVEGTYTTAEAKEKEPAKKRPILRRPAGRGDAGSGKALGELLGRLKHRSVGPAYTAAPGVPQFIPGPVGQTIPGPVVPASSD